jgi:hypothetical protein
MNGYLNRVQREAGSQMWLFLFPDHKTIANFRKEYGGAVKKVCGSSSCAWLPAGTHGPQKRRTPHTGEQVQQRRSAKAGLLNHLVDAGEQCWRYWQARAFSPY